MSKMTVREDASEALFLVLCVGAAGAIISATSCLEGGTQLGPKAAAHDDATIAASVAKMKAEAAKAAVPPPPPPVPPAARGPATPWEEVTRVPGAAATFRARTPHGWLVVVNGYGATYVPDEAHEWLTAVTDPPPESETPPEASAP